MGANSKKAVLGSTVDPLVEAYKKDVDRASIRENLRRSVEERIRNLQSLQQFSAELRRAGRKLRSLS